MRALIVLMALMLMIVIISTVDYLMPSNYIVDDDTPMEIIVHDDLSGLEHIETHLTIKGPYESDGTPSPNYSEERIRYLVKDTGFKGQNKNGIIFKTK